MCALLRSSLNLRVIAAGTCTAAVGALGIHMLEDSMSALDSLYLSVMTLSTVGYGDKVPTNSASRMFVCLLSLAGLGIFGAAMNVAASWRKEALQRRGYLRHGAVLLELLATLVSGALCWALLGRGTSVSECLYFALVTATTIGYGDIAPQTAAGKVAVMLYAVSAIPVMAAAIDASGAAITSGLRPEAAAVAVPKKEKKKKKKKQR